MLHGKNKGQKNVHNLFIKINFKSLETVSQLCLQPLILIFMR